jgi:hypothetical protein
MRPVLSLALLAVLASAVSAQPAAPAAPSSDQQIALAVQALPMARRAGATVMGFTSGKLVRLRSGTGDMICLADDPSGKNFHVSCYHRSLEPFMAKGRELRARGLKTKEAIDSARLAELKAGRFAMPTRPALLYQLFAPRDSVDVEHGAIHGASALYVVYTPNATEASTGLSAQPIPGGPWIMFPGTPWAHIMIQPNK